MLTKLERKKLALRPKVRLFYMYDTFIDTVNKFFELLYKHGGKVLWRPHFVDWQRKMGFVVWFEIGDDAEEKMLKEYSKYMTGK